MKPSVGLRYKVLVSTLPGISSIDARPMSIRQYILETFTKSSGILVSVIIQQRTLSDHAMIFSSSGSLRVLSKFALNIFPLHSFEGCGF